MKIGILSGEIPPPAFIDQLVIGLAIKGHEVFLYGSERGMKYKSSHKLLIIRNISENKFILFFKNVLDSTELKPIAEVAHPDQQQHRP